MGLQFYILVKQYQACREVLFRVAGAGSHEQMKIFGPGN